MPRLCRLLASFVVVVAAAAAAVGVTLMNYRTSWFFKWLCRFTSPLVRLARVLVHCTQNARCTEIVQLHSSPEQSWQ